MQVKLLSSAALLGAASTALSAPTTTACFVEGIQPIIQTTQGYINNVILDIAQEKHADLALDYTATGRGLSYFERSVAPDGGCAPSALAPAATRDQALADLQGVQAELNILAQDAINGGCANGELSICRAVDLYESVAQFVNSVRIVE